MTLKPVSLLTLNCYVFPPLISYFGSSHGHEKERVDKLAQALLKMENKPDILTCQELWSNQKKDQLYTQIKEEYPYFFEDRHLSMLSIGSGLAIYSKYRIERAEIHRFNHWKGLHEFFANKGFIIAKIRVDDKPIYVVTTHLQGGDSKHVYLSPYSHLSTEEIRAEQLKQINEDVKKFIETDQPGTQMQNHTVILSGDLNMYPIEAEYENINKAFPTVRNLAKKTQKIAGTSFNEKGEVKPKMLDHILCIGKPVKGSSKIIKDIDYSISDHLAVLGKMYI